MTTNTQLADPRPVYAAATEWALSLVGAVTPDQLDRPTPCDEFDVRALIGHILATVGRAEAIATRGTVDGAPTVIDAYDPDTFAEFRERALAAWSDDALLDRPVSVPWGQVPGRGALFGYVNEAFVHGWDLAVATGQPCEAPDADFAEGMLAVVPRFLPAEIRPSAGVPFDGPVEPREGAGPTERLANWSGRASEGWI